MSFISSVKYSLVKVFFSTFLVTSFNLIFSFLNSLACAFIASFLLDSLFNNFSLSAAIVNLEDFFCSDNFFICSLMSFNSFVSFLSLVTPNCSSAFFIFSLVDFFLVNKDSDSEEKSSIIFA